MINQNLEFIENPTISVIICAYNREKLIGQTIDSVLSQKCNFSYEVIIGEDFGTDKTREICKDYQKKYPKKIKLLLQNNNQGLGANWALCIKEARGKYIASCDDDDYWHNPNKLQIQYDYLEKHPECGMLHTEKDVLNEKNSELLQNFNSSNKLVIPQGKIIQKIFKGDCQICVSTSLIRKKLMDQFVPINEYILIKFNIQDWPTWIILSKYSEIHYIPISTTTYRIGHEAISNIQSYEKLNKKLVKDHRMFKFICNLFPIDLEYSENGYLIYINNVLLNLAIKKNDFNSAQKYAITLKSLGEHGLKTKIASKWLTFKIFFILKRAKYGFKG